MAATKPSFIQKYQNENKPEASPDQLSEIRKKAASLRDLTHQKAQLEEDLKITSAAINLIQHKELPDLMAEAQIDNLGLEASGNYPAYDLVTQPFYHANIGVDNPDADKAYAWLIKHGHGDLIKHEYTVTFTRGEEKAAKAFEKLLATNKIEYDHGMGVPWNTLTAFVREQTEKGVAMPLALFNATIGRIARLKIRKEKKAAAPRKRPTSY